MNTDITKQMEMVLYRTEDDNVTVSALIKDETIWITQKAMAELFGVQTPAISKHLKNIFEQGELREEVVVSKMEIPFSAACSKFMSINLEAFHTLLAKLRLDSTRSQ